MTRFAIRHQTRICGHGTLTGQHATSDGYTLPVVNFPRRIDVYDGDDADQAVVKVEGMLYYLAQSPDGGSDILVSEMRGVDYGGNVHRVRTPPQSCGGIAAPNGSIPIRSQPGEPVFFVSYGGVLS